MSKIKNHDERPVKETRPEDINPFVWGEPDIDFDEQRNKKVIAEVAANNWKNREKKRKEYAKQLEERTDAVAQYITSDKYAKTQNPWRENVLNNYFGKRTLARLRGEYWLNHIKSVRNDNVITPKQWEGIKRTQDVVNIPRSRSDKSATLRE